jgi:mRNA interferase MazF
VVSSNGTLRRGEIWWAATPGGDRPVLVLTRDPIAGRIGAVVVVALTRTVRGLISELPLGPEDGLPVACVASFDNLHTLRREAFRRPIAGLGQAKLDAACQVLTRALGCV